MQNTKSFTKQKKIRPTSGFPEQISIPENNAATLKKSSRRETVTKEYFSHSSIKERNTVDAQ